MIPEISPSPSAMSCFYYEQQSRAQYTTLHSAW